VPYYSIYEAIARNNLQIDHLASEEMLIDARTKAIEEPGVVARMGMT